MKSVIAALALAVGSNALAIRDTASCCFHLSASGAVTGTVGQLSDGQNRVGGGLPQATYCINGGSITDANGRGCILTRKSLWTGIDLETNESQHLQPNSSVMLELLRPQDSESAVTAMSPITAKPLSMSARPVIMGSPISTLLPEEPIVARSNSDLTVVSRAAHHHHLLRPQLQSAQPTCLATMSFLILSFLLIAPTPIMRQEPRTLAKSAAPSRQSSTLTFQPPTLGSFALLSSCSQSKANCKPHLIPSLAPVVSTSRCCQGLLPVELHTTMLQASRLIMELSQSRPAIPTISPHSLVLQTLLSALSLRLQAILL